MDHKVRFIRDPASGVTCLICSCGYNARAAHRDDLVEAGHIPPISTPPPVDLRKFFSGIPKTDWDY